MTLLITRTRREPPAHGSLLCQDAAGRAGLGLVLDGLWCGFSEEPVWGCEPAALESESLPRCPPEPVTFSFTASSSIVRKTASDSRRLRHRMASFEDFPAAFFRS